MKQMTDYQRELAAQNLDLVDQTIRRRIKITGEALLTYDDFYQVGCEALCKAAMKYTYERGSFEPFASRVIYNAIIDYCRSQQRHSFRRYDLPLENDNDDYALTYLCDADVSEDRVFYQTLKHALETSKERYHGVALRGIEALELKSLGYSCVEIARRYGTTPNNVTAWMSRAREKLLNDPAFRNCLA